MNKFKTLSELLIQDKPEYKRFMSRNVKRELIEAVVASGHYEYEINYLLETILLNNLETSLFEGTLKDNDLYSYIVEKTVADWFKEKAEKAKEWIKDGADQAKQKGTQIIAKIGDSFNNVVKMIVDAISGFLTKAWDFIKGQVSKEYSKYTDDVKAHVKRWKDDAKHDAAIEMKNMKTMAQSGANYVIKKFPSSAQGAIAKTSNTETNESIDLAIEQALYCSIIECIKEDSTLFFKEIHEFESFTNNFNLLNESEQIEMFNILLEKGHGHDSGAHIASDVPGLPGLSMISRKLSKFPPFKWLHNIEHIVGNKVNNVFEKVSVWLNKVASAPGPFIFIYIGSVAGLIAGASVKAGTTDIIKFLGEKSIGALIVAALPGIAWLLTVLKVAAKGMWLVEVISLGLEIGGAAATKIKPKSKGETSKPETKPASTEDTPEETSQ